MPKHFVIIYSSLLVILISCAPPSTTSQVNPTNSSASLSSDNRCPAEATVKTVTEANRYDFVITNRTSESLNYYYLDAQGRRNALESIAPRSSQDYWTSASVPVVITDEDDNCLFVFVGEYLADDLEIVFKEIIVDDAALDKLVVDIYFNDPTLTNVSTNGNCTAEAGLRRVEEYTSSVKAIDIAYYNNSNESIRAQALDESGRPYEDSIYQSGESGSWELTKTTPMVVTNMSGECLFTLSTAAEGRFQLTPPPPQQIIVR